MITSVFVGVAVPAGVTAATSADATANVGATPAAASVSTLATFDDTIGGVEATGALKIRVVDGNVRVFRWTGTDWSGQYYLGGTGGSSRASDTALYVDGQLYDLPEGSTADSDGDDLTVDDQFVTNGGSTVVSEFVTPEGVELVQRVTYVDGEQKFDLEWAVTNGGSSSVSDLRLFNLKDTYLAGGDNGEGFWDGSTNTIGVEKTVSGQQQRLSMRGITAPFAYQSNWYSSVRSAVSNGALTNDVNPNNHDNGYGLEWRRATLAAGDTWTVRARESFSLSPIIVTGPGTVTLSGDTVDLDFGVENFGSSSTDVSFATSGPSGWTLTTPADVTVPAGGSETVTVTADPPAGTAAGFYDVELTASGGGSSDTGVAQVEVLAGATQVDDCRVIDTPGQYQLSRNVTQTVAGSCIVITSSDVDFDGDGFTVDNAAGTGSDRFAVDADGRSVGGLTNVTIRNVVATGFDAGIGLRGTDDSTVDGVVTRNNRVIGVDVRTGSGGNVVSNVDSTNDGLSGVRMFGDGGNTVLNVAVDGSSFGLDVSSPGNDVSNVVVTGSANSDVRLGSGSNNVVTDLALESATVAELRGERITVGAVGSPPAGPANYQDLGQYVAATNTSAGGFMNLTLAYVDGDVAGTDESTLAVWNYDGATWTQVPGSTVDMAANRVSADVSSFSVFAPFVSAPSDTVAPTISNFDAIDAGNQVLEVRFDADETLDGIEVEVTDAGGTVVATLTEADFSVGGTTYTGSVALGTDGTFTATLLSATDPSGNDGATGQSDTVAIAAGTPGPKITNYAATNPGGQDLRVRFDASEPLDAIEVAVVEDGTLTRVATLTEADFSVGGTTYTATIDLGADGTFTATLLGAADAAGNDGATGQAGTVTIDTLAPDLTDFRVGNPDGRTVRIGFDASKPLADVEIVVESLEDGTEVGRLTEGDLDRSGARYTGEIVAPADGRYRVTILRAADSAGRDGAAGRSAIVVVDSVAPLVEDFTVTNPRDRDLRISFAADEPLASVIINLNDGGNETVFSVVLALFAVEDDRYTATLRVGRSGTYVGRLVSATDANGNDGAAGQTDSVTIPERQQPVTDTTAPNLVEFAATNPDGRTVAVDLAADEPLDGILVELTDDGGAVVATLTEADFELVDGRYRATTDVDGAGVYTATLLGATDAAGNDGATVPTDAVVTVVFDSVADYAGADGAVDIDELRDAIADWATGLIDTDLLRAVIEAWARGAADAALR